MKRPLIPLLLLALLYVTATAQGEWKWAHYWTGSDGAYTSYYNYITNTAFDDEGNLYVYGSMGNNPIMDGEPFEFSSQPMPGVQDAPAILLAKFDTLGNMLWYKVVKSQTEGSYPHWMEVRDNRICISGSSSFFGSSSYAWLYFMDTLITKAQIDTMPAEERKPPFKTYSRWTFFAQFDTDGELSDCHFVEAFSREVINGIRTKQSLCPNPEVAPTHNDRNGNTYLFSYIIYGGTEADPYTIMIDGDTNRTYNLFLPGNTDRNIENAMLYKFTPEWTLDFAHLLVNHTDGIATPYEFTHDSINPLFRYYPRGLSYDDEENMYLSGRIELVLSTASHGGNLHNYPAHIWWDDSHYLTINDISSAESANFVIKYNTDGQVVWSNQLYKKGGLDPNSNEGITRASWHGNYYYDNSVFIIGGGYYNGENALIYFDNEDNPLHRFLSADHSIVFVARFNSISGEYINHAIVPASQPMPSKNPFVINDRVVALSSTDFSDNEAYITQWDMNGNIINVMDTISVSGRFDVERSFGIQGDVFGHLSAGLLSFGSVNFGNGVSVNCNSSNSNAVIALYHDPELLVPYVKVPEYQGPKPEVRLWPNPATDKITIESEADFPIKSIAITDLQGRLLTVLPGNDVRHTLNIHKLPVGTYIAHIETKAGITDVKFVKGE